MEAVAATTVLAQRSGGADLLAGALVLAQLGMALFVLAVWSVRMDQATTFRPHNATSIAEEFEAYGFPGWTYKVVGTLKVACAWVLLLGIAVPALTPYGAAGLGLFMVVAVGAHLKVGDPATKTAPSAFFACLSLCLYVSSLAGDGVVEGPGYNPATQMMRYLLCLLGAASAVGMVAKAYTDGTYRRVGLMDAPLLEA